jgi:hypothetical protein
VLTPYGHIDYPIQQCEPRPKAQHIHTFPANSGNGSGCGGLFEVVSVRLGRPVEVQCGIENPPPLLAKRQPTKRPPNPADCFGRNVRNVRNVFGAVCFAHTGVSGTSVSVRHEFCVAVRVDLLKALSHYVKCIAKSFNISVGYTSRYIKIHRQIQQDTFVSVTLAIKENVSYLGICILLYDTFRIHLEYI